MYFIIQYLHFRGCNWVHRQNERAVVFTRNKYASPKILCDGKLLHDLYTSTTCISIAAVALAKNCQATMKSAHVHCCLVFAKSEWNFCLPIEKASRMHISWITLGIAINNKRRGNIHLMRSICKRERRKVKVLWMIFIMKVSINL